MKKIKILLMAAGFLFLMFLGGSQFRPSTVSADDYSVASQMRSYKSFDGSKLSDADIYLIARGFDHYDRRHTENMKRYIDDAIKKAIQDHERNKHR